MNLFVALDLANQNSKALNITAHIHLTLYTTNNQDTQGQKAQHPMMP